MKKLILGLSILILNSDITAHAAATGIQLELVNPSTGLSTETFALTSSTLNFSLDIAVQESGETDTLGSFDVTLAMLPSGLTFDGYTNLVAGFLPNTSTGLHYSATVNTQDVTINSAQLTLVVANFTASAPGSYAVGFIAPGGFQELADDNFNPLSFTNDNNTATIAMAPEPVGYILLLSGLGLLMVFGHCLRVAGRNS
jgi:hypothetical protein